MKYEARETMQDEVTCPKVRVAGSSTRKAATKAAEKLGIPVNRVVLKPLLPKGTC